MIRRKYDQATGFGGGGRCLALSLVVAGLAFPAVARAQVSGTISAGAARDDNIFRVAGGTPSPGCRSDTLGFGLGQIGYDFGDVQPYPSLVPMQWTGGVSGSVEQIVVRCNTALDNTPLQTPVHVASPQLGPIDFAVNVDASRRLTSFGETASTVINRHGLVKATGHLALHITPDFSLLLTPGATISRNSSAVYQPLDYNQFSVGAGIGYASPLGNSVALIFTRTISHGARPYFQVLSGQSVDLSNDTSEQSAEIRLAYDPSVFTSIALDVGYASRDDRRSLPAIDQSLRSNYRGPIGSARLSYRPNDGLELVLSATRQLASQEFLIVDSTRTDFVTFNLGKRIGRDVRIIAKADYIVQKIQYPLAPGFVVGTNNRLVDAQISIAEQVLPRVDVNLAYLRQQRLSGGLNPTFADNTVQLQVTFEFGKPECTQIICA